MPGELEGTSKSGEEANQGSQMSTGTPLGQLLVELLLGLGLDTNVNSGACDSSVSGKSGRQSQCTLGSCFGDVRRNRDDGEECDGRTDEESSRRGQTSQQLDTKKQINIHVVSSELMVRFTESET